MTYELRAKSYIIAPIGWMAFIFALSSIPGQAFEILPMSSIITNLAHIPLFGGLAYLWMRAFRNKEVGYNKVIIYTIIATLGYAMFDEFHQSFVPGREASFGDIALDTLGCLSAVIIWKLVNSQESKDCRP